MNIIDLKTRQQIKTTAQTERQEPQGQELERFKHLRDLIEQETTNLDKSWLDHTDFNDYMYCLEDSDSDDLLQNFRENYSSRQIGFTDFDELDGKDIAKAVPKDILIKKIFEHAELESCDDHYIQWNEMGSIGIGEYEHQIDIDTSVPEIAVAIACMTDAELKRFNQWCYAHVKRGHFCAFGYPCERLILKLDAQALLADPIIQASLALTYTA